LDNEGASITVTSRRGGKIRSYVYRKDSFGKIVREKSDVMPQEILSGKFNTCFTLSVNAAGIERSAAKREGRLKRYGRMTETKFIALIEKNLNRRLTPEERRKAKNLFKKLTEIRRGLRVPSKLDEAMRKGGRHNLCIQASRKTQIVFKRNDIPLMVLTKRGFLNLGEEPSTLYPPDDRVRHMWTEFGQGDMPVHLYTVLNFLGVALVVELTGDQFVRDQRAETFANIGCVIIPVKDLKEHDWPYVGGSLGLTLDDESQKRLLAVVNNDRGLFRVLTGTEPTVREVLPLKADKDG
jgi:hypothetical protein